MRLSPLGLGKVARALGQREGCGRERDWDLSKVTQQGPSFSPPPALCLFGGSWVEQRGPGSSPWVVSPLGGSNVSPVRQVSQHDPPNQYARHEHRLGHLLQFVGVADQVPLCKRKVAPARLSADQPCQSGSACTPTHACSLSQHPPLTSPSLAPASQARLPLSAWPWAP